MIIYYLLWVVYSIGYGLLNYLYFFNSLSDLIWLHVCYKGRHSYLTRKQLDCITNSVKIDVGKNAKKKWTDFVHLLPLKKSVSFLYNKHRVIYWVKIMQRALYTPYHL